MSTFTASIRLHDADEGDYTKLQNELETFAKKKNQHVIIHNWKAEESKYNWEGDVTIEKIADTIFKAAPKTGKKYSFHIVRNK